MVFIKGRKDILRVVKPAFKDQIWFLRLENAQITNLSLIFEISCAQKCSKQRNKGLRLLEMLKKPVGNCRNNLRGSGQFQPNLCAKSHIWTYVSRCIWSWHFGFRILLQSFPFLFLCSTWVDVNNLAEKLIWKGLVRLPDARYLRDSYFQRAKSVLALSRT